jgi:hypothetical protein
MSEQVTRIRLAYTSDPYTKLKDGSLGTKLGERIDPYGDLIVRVKWDNGSSMSLIDGQDTWTEFVDERNN